MEYRTSIFRRGFTLAVIVLVAILLPALTSSPSGFYFVSDFGRRTAPQNDMASAPWPVNRNTIDGRMEYHNKVWNIVAVDGHGESIAEPYRTESIRRRMIRKDQN